MSQQDTLAAAEAEERPAPAALPALHADPEPEPTWTRRDEKLLELLLFSRNWRVHAAELLAGKTPAQVLRRRERVFSEVRSVLEDPGVETPREWDHETPPETAAGPAATTAAPGQASVVPAAEDGSAVPTVAAGGGGGNCSEEGQGNKTKKKRSLQSRKKAEKWTREEHMQFLVGIKTYGAGNWKTMARELVTTKTASQIASHHQKHTIRQEQRKRDGCKRASIHDITEAEPTPASAPPALAGAGDGGGEPTREEEEEEEEEEEDDLDGAEGEDTGEDNSGDEPSEDDLDAHEDEELSLFDELFPGEDDPGTLLT